MSNVVDIREWERARFEEKLKALLAACPADAVKHMAKRAARELLVANAQRGRPYPVGPRFYEHAGCPILWKMVPFATPISRDHVTFALLPIPTYKA